jgi:hypothetical protein
MHDSAPHVCATPSGGLALVNHRAAYVLTLVDSGLANVFCFSCDSLGLADNGVPDMTTPMPPAMSSPFGRPGFVVLILKTAGARRLRLTKQRHE